MLKLDQSMEDKIGRLVGAAGKALRRALSRNLGEHGFSLSAEQAILLLHLRFDENTSQTMIAEHFALDKVSVTRWIDELERQKLAVRVQDRADRRQNIIYITDEGKIKCDEMLPVFELTSQQALQGIDPQQVEVCKDVLRKLFKNLCG